VAFGLLLGVDLSTALDDEVHASRRPSRLASRNNLHSSASLCSSDGIGACLLEYAVECLLVL